MGVCSLGLPVAEMSGYIAVSDVEESLLLSAIGTDVGLLGAIAMGDIGRQMIQNPKITIKEHRIDTHN